MNYKVFFQNHKQAFWQLVNYDLSNQKLFSNVVSAFLLIGVTSANIKFLRYVLLFLGLLYMFDKYPHTMSLLWINILVGISFSIPAFFFI